MNKMIKKLFAGINLTWPKLIIAAVIAGVITAVIAIIPIFYPSLRVRRRRQHPSSAPVPTGAIPVM